MAKSLKPKSDKPAARRKKKAAAAPGSVGLAPAELRGACPKEVEALARAIDADGGAALAPYRDPLGGHWVVLAALPLGQVEPRIGTPKPSFRAPRRRFARKYSRD
jgi:ParB family chromosome partitioning protein